MESVGSATGASTRNFSAEKYPCSPRHIAQTQAYNLYEQTIYRYRVWGIINDSKISGRRRNQFGIFESISRVFEKPNESRAKIYRGGWRWKNLQSISKGSWQTYQTFRSDVRLDRHSSDSSQCESYSDDF